ncbi:unnamed protein product [Caenorhabditis auriculariae]|uniref:RING-type domain-containing protein n=1 Tax=Caenorhabditis auriculariae TaxID=2777116 RepID=A0A8S1GYQ1_9PELO|nr:unnamed protein product [Caenorhabditis auriculariae]
MEEISDFLHCNKCYALPHIEPQKSFFVTTCMHLLCNKCVLISEGECVICGHMFKKVAINSSMNNNVKYLFKNPHVLFQEEFGRFMKQFEFQQNLMNGLLSHLKKVKERSRELEKYCKRQKVISEENERELTRLREWIKKAESRITEGNKQNLQLEREVQRLRQRMGDFSFQTPLMTSRSGSSGFLNMASPFPGIDVNEAPPPFESSFGLTSTSNKVMPMNFAFEDPSATVDTHSFTSPVTFSTPQLAKDIFSTFSTPQDPVNRTHSMVQSIQPSSLSTKLTRSDSFSKMFKTPITTRAKNNSSDSSFNFRTPIDLNRSASRSSENPYMEVFNSSRASADRSSPALSQKRTPANLKSRAIQSGYVERGSIIPASILPLNN